MRCIFLMPVLAAALLGSGPAWCDEAAPVGVQQVGIQQVLERSQEQRLQSLDVVPDDDPRARLVRASFNLLLLSRGLDPNLQLRVVRGPLWGETIHGRMVVANQLLADLPEAERLFVLAHELGHVVLGHWSQMTVLYRKWIPGPVTQDRTDAIAAALGSEASTLSYRQEFEADAYAGRTLRMLGIPDSQILPVFSHMGEMDSFATHPSADQRIAALHALR
jgi:Zn-dependent protease with chaperone function